MQDGVVASVVSAFVAFGEAQGLGRAELLCAAHLREDDLANPDGLVTPLAMMGLWRLLVSRLPAVVVPLAAADSIAGRMGIVGKLLRHAGTLREGLAICERYGRLSDGAVVWSTEERDGALVLALRHHPEVHALGLEGAVFASFAIEAGAGGLEMAAALDYTRLDLTR